MGKHPEKRVYPVTGKAQRRWLQAIDDRRNLAVQLAHQPVAVAEAKLAEAQMAVQEAQRKAQAAITGTGRRLQGELQELLEDAHPDADLPEGARVVYDTDAGTVTVLVDRKPKTKTKPKDTPPGESGDAAPGAPDEPTPDEKPQGKVTPLPKKKPTRKRSRKKASR